MPTMHATGGKVTSACWTNLQVSLAVAMVQVVEGTAHLLKRTASGRGQWKLGLALLSRERQDLHNLQYDTC